MKSLIHKGIGKPKTKTSPSGLIDVGSLPIASVSPPYPTDDESDEDPEPVTSTISRVFQNFLLVWLDAHIDEINDDDCRNTINQLKKVVNTIKLFTNTNKCLNFLFNVSDEKIFMIVSGSLGQEILPHIHHLTQLSSIFIFCQDVRKHDQWAKEWPKIKGVFNEIPPICDELKHAIQQCDHNSIPISFVPTNNETSTTNLNQLDQSFMYTQILKEILFDIDFGKTHKKQFVTYCRNQFADNQNELTTINKFKHDYRRYTPIWWYTSECFIYSMLNRALRLMEVDIIILMGFFIRDLHHQIEKLHKKQYKDNQHQSFLVYRGQGLIQEDVNQMAKTKGGLLSFNNFLSTSKNRNVSLIYARRAITDFNLAGIVFKMEIDPSISSTPFALVNDFSFYKESEQEILFSMHTVFRIGEISQIEMNNKELLEVELTLTSDNDEQLNELTHRMRHETQGTKGWYCLGQLLLKLGNFDKAEEVYKLLLNQTSNDIKKGNIYHQLGLIKVNLGNFTEAIAFFKKTIELDEKILPPSHRHLATSYDSIGSAYDEMGEYTKALTYHEKALAIYRINDTLDHSHVATSLNNIGLVYYKLNEYPQALKAHNEALEIYKKTLPPNHPSLAASYNNIGIVYDKIDDYSKALWFYEKTLFIYRKTLPPNHRDVAICHQNIGKALEKMCEYSNALSHHEKALKIFQKTLPSYNPHLATCYNHIGSVYYNVNEYFKALSFYQKALDIRKTILPSNHPDLIASYNGIAGVYEPLGKFDDALVFYQKSLEISRTIFPENHPQVAAAYNNVARIYCIMNRYNEALSYAKSAVDIGQKTSMIKQPDLLTYTKTLESVKSML